MLFWTQSIPSASSSFFSLLPLLPLLPLLLPSSFFLFQVGIALRGRFCVQLGLILNQMFLLISCHLHVYVSSCTITRTARPSCRASQERKSVAASRNHRWVKEEECRGGKEEKKNCLSLKHFVIFFLANAHRHFLLLFSLYSLFSLSSLSLFSLSLFSPKVPPVYYSFLSKKLKPYPSTLYVSVTGVQPPSVTEVLERRPRNVFERESHDVGWVNTLSPSYDTFIIFVFF